MAGKKVSGDPTPEGSAPGGDWREVTQALDALGDSITRAMRTAVENDEYRRRIRELRDGLAYLAIRIGEPAEPAGYREPMRPPTAMMPETSAWAVPPAQPQGLDAFRVANEKFRQGAGSWDTPAPGTPATAPVDAAAGAAMAAAVPAPAPVPSGGSVWSASAAKPAASSVWSAAPAPAPASVQAAAASYVSPFAAPVAAAAAPAVPAVPVTPPAPEDLLGAIRATNERFQAERAAATAAAAAAAPAPAAVPDWIQAGEEDEMAPTPFDDAGEPGEATPPPIDEAGEPGEAPEADADVLHDTSEAPVEEEHPQLFEEMGEDGPGDTPPPSPPSDFTP